MDYIVFDLEWNQGRDKKEEKKTLPFEIIEIGAVKLDDKRNVKDTFTRVICPIVYPKLYEITKRLIDLKEEELRDGVSFMEAGADFIEWCGDDFRFCTWGSADLTVLQQNLDYFGVRYKMDYPLYYYDVQQLYSEAFEEEHRVRNLEYAVGELKIPQGENFHRAISDARYTAQVFEKINPKLVKKYPALDLYCYPGSDEEPICVHYPEYRMTVSRTCSSREEVRGEKEMLHLYCCICGRRAKKLVPWFTENSGSAKVYRSAVVCRVHGYLKGRLVIKNPAPAEYFGIQTISLSTEAESIQLKQHYIDRRKKKK